MDILARLEICQSYMVRLNKRQAIDDISCYEKIGGLHIDVEANCELLIY